MTRIIPTPTTLQIERSGREANATDASKKGSLEVLDSLPQAGIVTSGRGGPLTIATRTEVALSAPRNVDPCNSFCIEQLGRQY